MTSMSAISAPTWLEGFGECAWPGLKAAVEVAPAAWVPTLPLAIEAPAVRLPASRHRRALPRPLRLARFAALVAVAGTTFVLSSGVALPHRATGAAPAPAGFAASLTSPFSNADSSHPSIALAAWVSSSASDT